MNSFAKGDFVLVYDRYRFAIPVRGYISGFAPNEKGVKVRLLTTNNANYPVGEEIWVDVHQLRLTTEDGLSPQAEKVAISARTGPQPIELGAWLASLSSAERKEVAIERGLFAYFPDALALVARHSVRSNEKHNPGQPVHWAREKSTDHGDCIGRHHVAIAVDRDSLDDGQPHIVCRAWRALADLQIWAEEKMKKGEKL